MPRGFVDLPFPTGCIFPSSFAQGLCPLSKGHLPPIERVICPLSKGSFAPYRKGHLPPIESPPSNGAFAPYRKGHLPPITRGICPLSQGAKFMGQMPHLNRGICPISYLPDQQGQLPSKKRIYSGQDVQQFIINQFNQLVVLVPVHASIRAHARKELSLCFCLIHLVSDDSDRSFACWR